MESEQGNTSRRKDHLSAPVRRSRFVMPGEALLYFRSFVGRIIICSRWVSPLTKQRDEQMRCFADVARELEGTMRQRQLELTGSTFNRSEFVPEKELTISKEVERVLQLNRSERTDDMIKLAMISLRNLQAFAEYPIHIQEQLCRVAQYQIVPPGRVILREGHQGEYFYIVIAGKGIIKAVLRNKSTREVLIDNVNELKRGQKFGDVALLHRMERTATVESVTKMRLLVIEKSDFAEIFMKESADSNEPEYISFLRKVDFLRCFPLECLKNSGNNCIFQYFSSGKLVVADSKVSDYIYIVKSGSCQVLKQLRATQNFGKLAYIALPEEQLMEKTARCTTADIAYSDNIKNLVDAHEEPRSSPFCRRLPLRNDSTSSIKLKREAAKNGYRAHPLKLSDSMVWDQTQNSASWQKKDGLEEVPEGHGLAIPTFETSSSKKVVFCEGTERHQPSHGNIGLHPQSPAGQKMMGFPGVDLRRLSVSCSAPRQGLRRNTKTDDFTPRLPRRSTTSYDILHGWARQKLSNAVPRELQAKEYVSPIERTYSELPGNRKGRIMLSHEGAIHSMPAVNTGGGITTLRKMEKTAFVQLSLLKPTDAFGLDTLDFDPHFQRSEISVSLVSNGAELILISKRYFLQNCNEATLRYLRVKVSPSPTETQLQVALHILLQWEEYKKYEMAALMGAGQSGLRGHV